MRIATTTPLWGHDSREAVAARLFDHIYELIDGPSVLGFPEGRPRRCRAYVKRIKKARELLAGEAVLSKDDSHNLRACVFRLESAAFAGGWL